MGHTVVMGRLTWESLPAKVRPLPGRRNVVVTRQADYMADGADVVTTLDDALTSDESWVIGGEQIYALALPIATRCEVTEVEIDLPRQDADAVAPVLDETWIGTTGEWLTSRSGLRYRFYSYQRASRPRRGTSRYEHDGVPLTGQIARPSGPGPYPVGRSGPMATCRWRPAR